MSAGAGPADAPDAAAAFVGAQWVDVLPRREACPELPAQVLLHAGPPLKGPTASPMLHAAVQALLYEGLAADEASARRQLAAGAVQLRPAQDHGVVTPLAQVVSASMPLFVVRHHATMAYGAVLEGPAPALRFGSPATACRERLARLSERLAAAVAPLVRQAPMPLDALIREAVAAGEDCHARTSVANAALVAALEVRGRDARRTLLATELDADLAALRGLPAFVLPLLMAGAAAALRHHGAAIEAVGGNGVEMGVRWRGTARWRTSPADAPQGERLAEHADTVALPAIGDSVVIDYCGLGGVLDAPGLRDALVDGISGIVDLARVTGVAGVAGVAPGAGPPVFNLAILDAAGTAGLIGRGRYRPPRELFTLGDLSAV